MDRLLQPKTVHFGLDPLAIPTPLSLNFDLFQVSKRYAVLNINWGTSCNFRALSSRQTVYQRRYLPLETYLSLKYSLVQGDGNVFGIIYNLNLQRDNQSISLSTETALNQCIFIKTLIFNFLSMYSENFSNHRTSIHISNFKIQFLGNKSL